MITTSTCLLHQKPAVSITLSAHGGRPVPGRAARPWPALGSAAAAPPDPTRLTQLTGHRQLLPVVFRPAGQPARTTPARPSCAAAADGPTAAGVPGTGNVGRGAAGPGLPVGVTC